MLEVQKLRCERGLRELFCDLSFNLSAGNMMRIVGGNGSGKSSLLNILAGVSSDYSGSIYFHGQRLSAVQYEYREQMLYLAHANAVKGGLTPYENLSWFVSLFPTKAEVTIEQALESVDLNAFMHQHCYRLSQGQRQRVALARLYLSSAKLWLLDEPFTAIDKEGVRQFEQLLIDFSHRGGAVLLTTHHDLHVGKGLRELLLDGS